MDAHVMKIHKLKKKLLGLEIHHVVRDKNVSTDMLSKLGSDRANVPPGIFVHELYHPSIRALDSSSIAQGPKEPYQEVLMIEVDWRVAFIDYIQEHKLPPDVNPKSIEASGIRHTHEVCQHGGGQRNTLRDSRRRVREPRRFSHTSRQGISIWFLLADCFGRCRSTHLLVHQLLIIWQKTTYSGS
jgi:hypothetical protein